VYDIGSGVAGVLIYGAGTVYLCAPLWKSSKGLILLLWFVPCLGLWVLWSEHGSLRGRAVIWVLTTLIGGALLGVATSPARGRSGIQENQAVDPDDRLRMRTTEADTTVEIPDRPRPPAPRRLSTSGSFDLVATSEGAMLAFVGHGDDGYPVVAVRVGELGEPVATIDVDTSGASAGELAAGDGVVAWVRGGARFEVWASEVTGPRPRRLGEVAAHRGPRGRLDVRGEEVRYLGDRGVCAQGLGERRCRTIWRGRACASGVTSAGDDGVCTEEGLRLLAAESSVLRGCVEHRIGAVGDALVVSAMCDGERRWVTSSGEPLDTPTLGCDGEAMYVEIGERHVLGSVAADLAPVLPDDVAELSTRAVFTGRVLLVAGVARGELRVRRYECLGGEVTRTENAG